jgi:hypothetical protein
MVEQDSRVGVFVRVGEVDSGVVPDLVGFVEVLCLCLRRSRVKAEEMRCCGGTSVEGNGSSTESRAATSQQGNDLLLGFKLGGDEMYIFRLL